MDWSNERHVRCDLSDWWGNVGWLRRNRRHGDVEFDLSYWRGNVRWLRRNRWHGDVEFDPSHWWGNVGWLRRNWWSNDCLWRKSCDWYRRRSAYWWRIKSFFVNSHEQESNLSVSGNRTERAGPVPM